MKSKYSKLPKWKRDFINRIKALNRFIDKLKQLPASESNLAFPEGSVQLSPIRHSRRLTVSRYVVN